MEIVGIAGLVVSAGAFLWGVGVWFTNRFREIDEKLSKHDTADRKLKRNVKVCKERTGDPPNRCEPHRRQSGPASR